MRLALVVASVVAFAAEARGLSVTAFEGKGAEKVQTQLENRLCRKGLCSDGDEPPDVLSGKVFVRGGKRLLDVELSDAQGKSLMQLRVPLVGRKYVAKVDRAVRKALAAPPQGSEEDEWEEDEAPAPKAAAEPAPPPAEPSPVENRRPAMPKTEGVRPVDNPKNEIEASAENARAGYVQRVVWVSAGVRMQSRRLAFDGLEDSRLYVGREAAMMPRAEIAVFPFAKEGKSGPGLTGSFASTVTSGPMQVASRLLDAQLAWGIRLGSAPVWVRPEAGYRWHLMHGTVTTDYRVVRGGLTLEAQLWRFTLWASGGYLHVIGGAGELTRDYFPRSRMQAAGTAEAGVALNLLGRLDVVVAGNYDVYLHALNVEAEDAWVARSANDGYLSVTASICLGI
jgi:hypothetical protein